MSKQPGATGANVPRYRRQRRRVAALCAILACTVAVDACADAPRGQWAGVTWTPTFEGNAGQLDARLAARVSSVSGSAFLSNAGTAIFQIPRSTAPLGSRTAPVSSGAAPAPPASELLALGLVDANPDPVVTFEDPAPTRSHYYLGNDPSQWRVNVPHYRRIRFSDVYPGIDQVFHAASGKLEFDFEVRPGARPSAIRLKIPDSVQTVMDREGNVQMAAGGGGVTLRRPLSSSHGIRTKSSTTIDSRFVLQPDGTLGIDVGEYDAAHTLVIDPVLEYSAFAFVRPNALAIDASGAAYISGTASRGGFSIEPTWGYNGVPADLVDSGHSSGDDAYVLKLTPDGKEVEYLAVFGGRSDERSGGIAVSKDGEAVVGVITLGPDFPVVNQWRNALLPTGSKVPYNAIIRLAADGASIRYSYFHSLRGDLGFYWTNGDPYIAIDKQDRTIIAVAGSLDGASLPSVPATESTYACGGVFITRTTRENDRDDRTLCLAGRSVHGLALGPDDSAHITGSVGWTQFGHSPISVSLANPTQFNTATWLTRVDLNASTVVHHTTWSGGLDEKDQGMGIATDEAGNSYVVGLTTSPTFPLVNALAAGLTTRSLAKDRNNYPTTFAMKVNPAGTAILYSTFLNLLQDADLPQHVAGVAVEPGGRAVVAGGLRTRERRTYDGDDTLYENAYVAKIAGDGTTVLNFTRLGGRYEDWSEGIALGRPGEIFVIGFTDSPDFPTRDPSLAWNGGISSTSRYGSTIQFVTAFIAKLVDDIAPATLTLAPAANPVDTRTPVWITATVPQASGILEWYLDGRLAATQALTGGKNVVAYSPGAMTAAAHSVRARYRSSADAAVLESQFVQTVNPVLDCP